MFETSYAAGEGPLEISHESKEEESNNGNKLVQNNLKAPFEIMVKLFSILCKLPGILLGQIDLSRINDQSKKQLACSHHQR